MTTLDNTSGDPVTGNYNDNYIGSTSTSQPGQVQGSSYAAMASAVFIIASLMSELNINFNKVAMQETEFGSMFNNQQRLATLKEGHASAMQQYMQMGASLTSALVSGAQLVAPYAMNNTGGADSLFSQRAAAQNDVKAMQGKRAALDKGIQNGSSPDDSGMILGSIADATEESSEVLETRERMLGGVFEDEEGMIEEAAKGANPQERTTMQRELNRQIEEKQQTLNYVQNRISSTENSARVIGDLGKELSNSIFHALQAHYVEIAAKYRADGISAQFNQQTDQRNAEMMLRWMSENYGYLTSVLQALGQIAASAG